MLKGKVRSVSNIDKKKATVKVEPKISMPNTKSGSGYTSLFTDHSKIPKSKIPGVKPVPAKSSYVPNGMKTPSEDKKFSIRRPSRTQMNIKIGPIKGSSTPRSYSARQSNTSSSAITAKRPSTASSLEQKVKHQNLGKIPAYLKRLNQQKMDNTASDKVKCFNAIKVKLRETQGEFFKALESVNESMLESLPEEYKLVALFKDGAGKLVVTDHNQTPALDGGNENKCIIKIKEKLNAMSEDIYSVTNEMCNAFKNMPEMTAIDCDFNKIKDLQSRFEVISSAHVSIFVTCLLKFLNIF